MKEINTIQIPVPTNVYDELPKSIEDLVSSQVRFEDEDFVDYKKRIGLESKLKKFWFRGRMFWNSSKLGTYRKTN